MMQSSKKLPRAWAAILVAITLFPGGGAQAQTLSTAEYVKKLQQRLQAVPVIAAQPDGVVYMNWEAGAMVTVARLAVQAASPEAPGWNGDMVRPYWRIKLTQGGSYRVVITRACPPNCESSGAIHIRSVNAEGRGVGRVGGFIQPTQSWADYSPFIMGDISLAAGEYLVEYYPYDWTSSTYLINLRDIRLIPIGALVEPVRQVQPLLKRLGIAEAPELQAARAWVEELRAQKRSAEALVRRSSFNDFLSYDQFLAYDRELPGARKALVRREAEIKSAVAQEGDLLRQLVQKRAGESNLKAEEARQLQEYLAAYATVQDSATREYPKVVFNPASPVFAGTSGAHTASTRKPLFPPGAITDFPVQKVNERLPCVELTLPQPPDLAARKAEFQARNSAQGLAQLCRRLAAVLVPGTPGLEEFERLAAAGKSREALEAYRNYFFTKLAEPEKFGASAKNIMTVMPTSSKQGQHIIMRPNPMMLENALAGIAVVQESGAAVRGKIGEPGEVLWAPRDLALPPEVHFRAPQGDGSPFWKTGKGREIVQRILFYQGIKPLTLGFSSDLSRALLGSYLVSGNRQHLARLCGYVDDYTMHAQADMDDSPVNIRSARDLEPHEVLPNLLLGLRLVLDERPEFAGDMDAATLARLMMYVVEEYSPYNLRLRRTQLANFGIMGLAGTMKVSAFLPEFKAINYFTREAWRLANMGFITYRELDGPCIESWDHGHARTEMDFYDSGMVPARLPQDVGDGMQQRYLWDGMRVIERNFLTHTSPQGAFWPDWRARDFYSAVSVFFLRPMWSGTGRLPLEHVKEEVEAQRRIEAITVPGGNAQPQRFSDYAPYAGISYLRDAWKPDAEYLLMQNVRRRSQSLIDAARTDYNLSKAGLCLVEGMPLAVDRKPENHFYDSIPTGGKTLYLAQSQRNVQQARFLSSARFDFSEGLQDSPYARFWDRRSEYMAIPDPFGLYQGKEKDARPIRDVRDLRQILHVRGEGLWLVHDRVLAPAQATHEYMQFFKVPVRLFPEGFPERVALLKQAGCDPIEENEQARLIRTANPGADNVSVRLFCRQPLQFANRLNARGEPERLPSQMELIGKALAAGQSYAKFMKCADMQRWGRLGSLAQRPVSVRWTGTGSQSLVTAMYVRPAVFQLAEARGNDVRETEQTEGPGGVVGCRIVTRTGAEVWFQGGPDAANQLAGGPVSATAETLLVMRKEGKISGLVLGCTQMTVEGKRVSLPRADFEFELGVDGALVLAQPIYKPIDTIRLQPDQTVFTDSLQVTAGIPGQDMTDVELHYTLQPAAAFIGRDYEVTRGEEPTLESPLYTGPITIRESSLLKVRAFRKGLKVTPWHCANTEASQTVTAIFRQQAPLPAVASGTMERGLNYAYAEGHWPTLFAYTGDAAALAATVGIKGTGQVRSLLDPADLARIRATDRAYAVRYSGYLQVPHTGVYNFYAPLHLYTPTLDAGYDLRVFVDGKEWWPNPMLHAENIWSVALEAGLHRLEVAYVDYRWKEFRHEYWLNWWPEQMWQGTPVLEISGPGVEKQPIPAAWLKHEIPNNSGTTQ